MIDYESLQASTKFDDLAEPVPDEDAAPLDRSTPPENMSTFQADYYRNGMLILPGFMNHKLIDAYCDRWMKDHDSWRPAHVAFRQVPELCEVAMWPPLMAILGHLIGEEMGLSLSLTNWVSTERNIHQDDYLNPSFINNHYAACWFALADIHPDSGPFEYYPGTHKWPVMRKDKLLALYPPSMADDPNWPKWTEPVVVRTIQEKLDAEGREPVKFLAKKGDVLIWSGRLVHRGSAPNVPGMERRSLICHYSALSKRRDMPNRTRFYSQYDDPAHPGQYKYFDV